MYNYNPGITVPSVNTLFSESQFEDVSIILKTAKKTCHWQFENGKLGEKNGNKTMQGT